MTLTHIEIKDKDGQWAVVTDDFQSGLKHVVPINDIKPHDTDWGEGCACGAYDDDEGVIVHASFDGREKLEPDYRGEKTKAN